MTEEQLKTRLGVYIICLNLGMIFLVLVCFWKGGFDADQLTTVLAIIIPMFSCYAVAAIRHLANHRYVGQDDSKRIHGAFALLSFGVPFLFAAVIVGAIILQAMGTTFTNFEQFKKVLLILEVTFSAYIGYTIHALFTPINLPSSTVASLSDVISEKAADC